MATIAENLQTIKDSTEAIKQAIIDKGVTISGGLTTYADAIRNISGGESGGSGSVAVKKKDVNFYDHDGTLLHSYTKSAFLALSVLPELPTREGLTCQEWNYNLEDAKEYVEEYGILDIGATYITDDGKTRLYINIATDGRMDVPIYFSQTVSHGVIIDWGDGTSGGSVSGTGNVNTTHKYNEIGDYVITLNPISGCTLGLGHNRLGYCIMGEVNVYSNMLQKVEIGNSVKSIGNSAFHLCYSLSNIVIPNSVTSIGDNVFYSCYSLSSIVIPNNVTRIGNYTFGYCHSLSNIVIPNSVTSIGDYAFGECHSLSNIIVPNGVTSIGASAFQYCYSLSSIIIPNGVTSIGASAFEYCYSLSNIVIPNSVTNIDQYAFCYCRSLSSIVIPNNVTHIYSGTFMYCVSLTSIVIPNSVRNILYHAFLDCYGMAYYDFSQYTSIPSLIGNDTFTNIPSDCEIIVPDSLYNSWKSATNWSNYAGHIIKKSDWDNGMGVIVSPGDGSGGSSGGS